MRTASRARNFRSRGVSAHSTRTGPKAQAPRPIKLYKGGIAEGSQWSQSGGAQVRPISALVEFCCGFQSLLGRQAQDKGLEVLRLTKETHDLTTTTGLKQAKREILGLIKRGQHIHLWASLPCKPWSKRNVFNAHRLGPKFRSYLEDTREESLSVIQSFLELACIVLRAKSQVSYERPAYAVGWDLPHLSKFFKVNGFLDVVFYGCALGLEDKGKPVMKPWRVKTTSQPLADALSQYKCICAPGPHTPCKGKITAASENYIAHGTICRSRSEPVVLQIFVIFYGAFGAASTSANPLCEHQAQSGTPFFPS